MDDEERRVLKKQVLAQVRNWSLDDMTRDSLRSLASRIASEIERIAEKPIGEDPETIVEKLLDAAEARIAALKAENEEQKAMIAKLEAEIEALKKPPVAAE